jgi:hypothetical protein
MAYLPVDNNWQLETLSALCPLAALPLEAATDAQGGRHRTLPTLKLSNIIL